MSKLTAAVAGVLLSAFGIGAATDAPPDAKLVAKWKDVSLHALKTNTLEGKPVELKDYAGKVCLVVNVASKCGLTPQYDGLEKLYGELKDKGFVILAFPSNDFGEQEPGSPSEIREFCSTKYHVSFPMFLKVQTKAGDGQAEIYEYLGTRTGSLPSWNFAKYLVGKDGQPISYFGPKVTPDAKELRDAIEKALTAETPKAPSAPAKPAAPKA